MLSVAIKPSMVSAAIKPSMLSVAITPSILSVAIKSVMLRAVMLNDVMLSVVAPCHMSELTNERFIDASERLKNACKNLTRKIAHVNEP